MRLLRRAELSDSPQDVQSLVMQPRASDSVLEQHSVRVPSLEVIEAGNPFGTNIRFQFFICESLSIHRLRISLNLTSECLGVKKDLSTLLKFRGKTKEVSELQAS